MNQKLQQAFDDLELQREQLLSGLRRVPPESLTSSPPGKWSILRILSHLITGERTGLEYVRKKILGIDSAGDTGIYEELKMKILVVSQRLRFLKYKAPRLIEERTVVYGSLDEVDKQWSLLRNEWRTLLDKIPDNKVNRKIFRHVVAGRLNLVHGLRFFGEHVIHHKPQIDALIKAR